MDNKIIIQLIKREINELSLLIDALENTTSPRDILIDVTKSKVETLSEVVNFLHKDANHKPALDNKNENFGEESQKDIIQTLIEEKTELDKEQTQKADVKTNIEKPAYTPNELSDIQEKDNAIPQAEHEPVNINNITEKEATDIPQNQTEHTNTEIIKPLPDEEEPTNHNIVEQKEDIDAETVEKQEAKTQQPETPPTNIIEDKTNNEETAVSAKHKTQKKVLGDQFTKEKSLNEKFTSLTETKYKVMGKPVTNIKKTIGLNDRFMFTRELFNNDSGKFNDTVEAIDNASDLVEAVEYLEKNCEWPKNETSLKFMDLVKRRFNN